MFGKVKKNTIEFKSRIYNLQWYPAGNGCACYSKKTKIQQMPPLMVRKAPWRQ